MDGAGRNVTGSNPAVADVLAETIRRQRDGDADGALAMLEAAIAAAPDVARYHRLANELYRQLGRHLDARATAQRLVAMRPDDPTAHTELAAACGNLSDIAGMRDAAERAIALAPDLAAAHFSRGAALLASGDFAEGWREYEWRLQLPGTAGGIPPAEWPRWDGGAIPHGRLLLFADQGRGDVIQFARYIPWVAARCPDLTICCPREMWPILRQFPELRLIVQHWHEAGRCDAFAPLGSLPLLAGTRLDTIPPPVLLRAEPARAAAWRARLDGLVPRGYRRIGLIWAGNSAHTADGERSTQLASFMQLASVADVALLALQKGPAQSEIGGYFGRAPLFNLGPRIHDFDDTMAVLEALDVLVSVDTGVVHLAGAMGKPTWVVLPFGADWRWLLDRDDSPWYPSVRLFRQPAPRAWAPTVAQVAAALGQDYPAILTMA
jgi:hypothetical protein